MSNYFVFKDDEGNVSLNITQDCASLILISWAVSEPKEVDKISRAPQEECEDLFENLEKEMSNDAAYSSAQQIIEEEAILWEQYAAAIASVSLSDNPTSIILSSPSEGESQISSFLRWITIMHNHLRSLMEKNKGFTIGEAQSADLLFSELYGDDGQDGSHNDSEILQIACSILGAIISELCGFWIEEAV